MIEPLSLASSFATVVGLLGLFKGERSAAKDQGTHEFLQWLEEHNHNEIKDLITHSHELLDGIETLLRDNHEVVLAKLNRIDEILASLSSCIQGMGKIGISLHPNAELSDQAISILRQLVNSAASEFIENRLDQDITTLHLMSGGHINIMEPRFLANDLDMLGSLRLLMVRFGSQGSRIFGITRNAAKLVELIDSE